MKLLPLVLANSLHKPVRGVLTAVALTTAFLLFGVLHGIDAAFDAALSRMRVDRLIIEPKFGEPPLPISYARQIRGVEGARDLTWTVFLPTTFQDPKNPVLLVASDPESFLRVRNEFSTTPGAVEAMRTDRTGVLILGSVAAKYGWKIGDRVTLQSPGSRRDGGADWPVNIVGILSNPGNPGGFGFGLMNYEYFNEARASARDTVGRYVVRISNPERSAEVSRNIDALFQSSSAPSRTKTENESARTQLAIVGDVTRMAHWVIGAVLIAILFMTANLLWQTVTERTRDLAVMKVLGFSDVAVVSTVVGEGLLLCGFSAIAGTMIAAAFFPQLGAHIPQLAAYLPPTPMPSAVMVASALVAVGLAIASAALPAWRALHVNVVDALGKT